MTKKTKKLLLRAFLLLLILLNMAVIFMFSAQDGESSAKNTVHLESTLTNVLAPDYEEKTVDDQMEFSRVLVLLLRKSGHMIVFGTLSAFIFLFLLTWKGGLLPKYAIALAFTLLYAISDEWHQRFVEGRSGKPLDVLIDFGGALLFTSVVLLIAYLYRRKKMKLKITYYKLLPNAPRLRVAVASDLHGMGHDEVLALLRAHTPDLILIPGDLTDDVGLADPSNRVYSFLKECAAIAPTYYSVGNHEIACYHKGNPWRHPTPKPISEEARIRIRETGAVLLDNTWVEHNGILICGLTSGINKKENKPNEEVLARIANQPTMRILLCHHPEYYVPYVRPTSIDLTVCGHAHGGQWRVFSQGIYAPGQGIFPKYTAGTVDGRCVISRGIGNHTFLPRIFNPPELLILELGRTPE